MAVAVTGGLDVDTATVSHLASSWKNLDTAVAAHGEAHLPILQPLVALNDRKEGGEGQRTDVIDLFQPESIKLSSEALKWYRQADTRQKALFLRRLQQLALGERSRILSKRLVGSKNYAVLFATSTCHNVYDTFE